MFVTCMATLHATVTMRLIAACCLLIVVHMKVDHGSGGRYARAHSSSAEPSTASYGTYMASLSTCTPRQNVKSGSCFMEVCHVVPRIILIACRNGNADQDPQPASIVQTYQGSQLGGSPESFIRESMTLWSFDTGCRWKSIHSS